MQPKLHGAVHEQSDRDPYRAIADREHLRAQDTQAIDLQPGDIQAVLFQRLRKPGLSSVDSLLDQANVAKCRSVISMIIQA